jgi:hypothetical protein
VWPLGQGFNLLNARESKQHKITITCDGPFGAVPPVAYVLDLLDWKGHMQHPTGSIHELTRAVADIGGKLGERLHDDLTELP